MATMKQMNKKIKIYSKTISAGSMIVIPQLSFYTFEYFSSGTVTMLAKNFTSPYTPPPYGLLNTKLMADVQCANCESTAHLDQQVLGQAEDLISFNKRLEELILLGEIVKNIRCSVCQEKVSRDDFSQHYEQHYSS